MKFLRWLAGFIVLAGLIITIFAFLNVSPLTKLLLFMLICAVLAMFRILRGPTPGDRAVGTDIFGIMVVGFCAILAIFTGKAWYMDIAIAWALQSFIGVLALAKFLEGRHFDE
ncbi:MAG: monovalent cation/H+ antiporter complex subunit F [Candidatus Omnitrophota bacterium]